MFRLLCALVLLGGSALAAGAGGARLACYVGGGAASVGACTHVVYTGPERGDKLDAALKRYRGNGAKILLRINENDKDLKSILKSKSIGGLEVHDAHRSLNRSRVTELVADARAALTAGGGGALLVALPASPELLAKYYDLRALLPAADLLVAHTHALGAAPRTAYHPSRLSGLWDMMNTDSVVDLVVGLGAPASKLLVTLPAAALHFELRNETLSTPGSPAAGEPRALGRQELCRMLSEGNWTLERDQDLSAPYAFRKSDWVAFEDTASVDVKAKYARVRGLAGLALVDAERDADTSCGPTLLEALSKALNSQRRAPRGAVLRSLESEILSSVQLPRALDALQVSPYRITQVVDSDGVIHSLREDTRTEFACSRQGYFVHPRSCGRFYRCVKFDQLSPDYTVFEFDCPEGLAFDSRYEVCVWPGSLPDSQACPGSSEIAPVPRTRFVCPEHEGYYADPENCRWFFACLDHGKAPLSAYEFRCPFGLGFDAARLQCDWPWLVPACGDIARYEAAAFGYSGAALAGATGFRGQSADSINIAAHQSLASGASLNNLVGVQAGFLSKNDALSDNFIAAEEYAGPRSYNEYASAYSTGAGVLDYGTAEVTGSLIKDAYAQKPVGFVNAANYGNSNSQYSQAVTGSYINDAHVEKKPLSAINSGSYSQNINLGLASGGFFNNGYENYDSEDVEITGSLIKDAYIERKPLVTDFDNTGTSNAGNTHYVDYNFNGGQSKQFGHKSHSNTNNAASFSSSSLSHGQQQNLNHKVIQAQNQEAEAGGQYVHDNSGAYVHDSTGDRHELYKHVNSVTIPYIHEASGSGYNHQSDHYNYVESYRANEGSHDSGLYRGNAEQAYNRGSYKQENSEGYRSDYAGAYIQDYSGSYNNDQSVQYVAGIYRPSYESASFSVTSGGDPNIGIGSHGNALYNNKNHHGDSYSSISQVYDNNNGYQAAQNNKYITDTKVYSGASHTLTAGAVSVGLVGKTQLIDADLNNKYAYSDKASNSGTSSVSRSQTFNTGSTVGLEPFSYVHQPSVAVSNVGSDSVAQNLNTYGYDHVTTLNSVGVAPTPPPVAVTTPFPTSTYSYKPTFVPTQSTSDIKEVFGYQQPAVTFVQPTATVVTSAPKVVHHVQPTAHVTNYNQATSHQAQNYERGDISISTGNVNNNGYNLVSQDSISKQEFAGYDYPKPQVAFEEPLKKLVAYTTAQPTINAYIQPTVTSIVQPVINTYAQPTISTYKPKVYSHQTYHQVEPQKILTVTHTPITVTQPPIKHVQLTGYDDAKPAVSFYENPLTKYVQDIRPVTAAPNIVAHYQPTTTRYIEQTAKYVPVQPVIQKHEVQHVVNQPVKYELPTPKQTYYQTQESYAYAPEIQRDIESLPSYRPSTVSHQVYHQTASKSQAYERKDQNTVTLVSSTPSNIIYENHYEYKAPVERLDYKQEQYVTPRQDYVEPYSSVSSTQAPIVHKQQHSVVHTPQVQSQYEYQARDYVKQVETPKPVVPIQPVSFSYDNNPRDIVESIHISSYSNQPASSTYKPIEYRTHYAAGVRNDYKAEEYLPPFVSTANTPEYLPPVVSTARTPTYIPPTVSTTAAPEYLPPVTYKHREYIPPKEETSYISVTSPKPIYKSSTQVPTHTYKSTTSVYKAPEYLPPVEDVDEPQGNYYGSYGLKEVQTVAPVSIKYNPIQEYAYNNVGVAPAVSTTALPVYRQHNLVVQTAKAQTNLLGFGTVGPDAGLIATPQYSTTAYPEVTQRYTAAPRVTSTYAPIRQEIVEVTPAPLPAVPVRRKKPKIAVVTKINDFNPLLVRKLGAVCSCTGQSPVLVLRGKKPNPPSKLEYDNDYSNDYDGSYNEEVNSQWSQKSLPYNVPSLNNAYLPATPAPLKSVTSTFNPIIVPDDSYYQDYQESRIDDKARYTQELPKEVYSENFVSSSFAPETYSASAEKTIRIRPRVKVTVAPTLKTVLVQEPVTPAIIVKDSQQEIGLSQPFDRYGPGGWRSRDETLQGSVDCKRAGLFRHPKHCNKFYACRWDCTKERFTLHVFNCPVQLSFDPSMGACNWPSQGPACQSDTLLTNGL